MDKLEILLFVAIACMGILLLILLHKITILKKQTDDIIEEVKAYVAFVTEEEKRDVEDFLSREKIEGHNTSNLPKKIRKEEMENHIIQAVLGEYFP